MPWKEPNVVDLRYELLRRLEAGERVSDLAREYGVSRKTIYKFQKRLRVQGIEGLRDLTRRPERLARKLPEEVEQAVLRLKKKYPTWGAKKIRARLPEAYPGVHVPAVSTVHAMLERNGAVKRRRRRRKVAGTLSPLTTPKQPNQVWGADFKGQFRLSDRSYCYPLTTSDLYSKYVLQCEALSSTREEPVLEAFWELFHTHGLPESIRIDNGVPFATTAAWGLSRLSVMWLRLGIEVQRIRPGCPQQNGSHERMHRTLKQEATRPAGRNLLEQQEKLDTFQRVFNHERPHEALAMRVPADVYCSSSRACPAKLPELDYPFADDVLTVHSEGHVGLHGRHRFYLTKPLAGQQVGVQEQLDGRWLVAFAAYDLGLYDPRQRRFEPFETLRDSSLGAQLT